MYACFTPVFPEWVMYLNDGSGLRGSYLPLELLRHIANPSSSSAEDSSP